MGMCVLGFGICNCHDFYRSPQIFYSNLQVENEGWGEEHLQTGRVEWELFSHPLLQG